MKKNNWNRLFARFEITVLAACLSALHGKSLALPDAGAPAVTPELIEADWLQQDERRGTSHWSSRTTSPARQAESSAPGSRQITALVERGMKLAASQRALGAAVGPHGQTLREVARGLESTPAASGKARDNLYMKARWAVREMALANPLLDFDTILFVKRAPTLFPHVSCHSANSKNRQASVFQLSPAESYDQLLSFGQNDLHNLVLERDRSLVGVSPSLKSKLMVMLTAADGHHGVHLGADELYRLAVWMDTYGHLQGAFSPEQEEQLRQFRQEVGHLLEEEAQRD